MSLVSVLESKDLSTVARRLNTVASRLSPEANDSEAALIVSDALMHMDALMSTCRSAIADGHVGAVEAALSVIRHIVDAEPQGFARRLVEHGMRQFHALASFFTPVVGHGTFGPQAAVMMMHVVQLLGAEPMAKDVAGDTLAGPLTEFLAAGLPNVTDPHLLKRRAVSCLLNLVQGHAENKERLRRYLPQLSRVVVAASEFFLQVQAAELVWRITRVHKAWLADPAVASALGANLQKELSGLAANDRLLDNLVAVLQAHNDAAPMESPSIARIVSLRCDSVEARLREGTEEVTKTHSIATTTTAFLSPSALVVLLPDQGPCAQITVPLHTFASAKLRTDGSFIIRLSDAPLTATAATSMCDFAPNDYLALALAGSALPRARAIPLRSWIVRAQGDDKALREAYEAAIRAPRPSTVPVGDAGGAASPAQGATSFPAPLAAQQNKSAPASRAPSKLQNSPPQRREREEPQPSFGHDPTGNGQRSAILSANPSAVASRMPSAAPSAGPAAASSMPPPDVPPARRPPMAERSGNATIDAKAPPSVQANTTSAPTSRAPSASRLPVFDFDRALSGADMPPAHSALRVTTPSFAAHQHQQQQQQQHYAAPSPSETMRNSSSSNFAGDAVEHFRKAIADRVAEKRGHTDQVLQWVLTSVQRNVDATKDANRRDRDNLEMLVQEELRALRVHEGEVKEHIGLRVKELDAALSELRTVSNVVGQRIEALGQRANDATAEARACESASLHELKRRVDADLATLEDTLYRAASQFDPRDFVEDFLNQNNVAAHH